MNQNNAGQTNNDENNDNSKHERDALEVNELGGGVYGEVFSDSGHGINQEKLKEALSVKLGAKIIRADCQTFQLHGGTLGDVRLVKGTAETVNGDKLQYSLVLKKQKKWERYGDPGSWRREYDLYASDFDKLFTGSLRWPECYLAEINGDEWQIWMEYVDGVSGLDLSCDMYVQAAEELGRFQGKLYAEQPKVLKNLTNLSGADAMKNFYLHYRSWRTVYDYIRSDDCEIPKHLCEMIAGVDNQADEIWRNIEQLPVVFCHRDFWVTNIFHIDSKIILIDWDTSGWGHLGEDIVSLIADEADVDNMAEYYEKCVPAYCKGFSEFTDISQITNIYIRERIILHFGYRLVEWFLNAKSPDERDMQINTLQKIYEMGSV